MKEVNAAKRISGFKAMVYEFGAGKENVGYSAFWCKQLKDLFLREGDPNTTQCPFFKKKKYFKTNLVRTYG